MFRTARLKHYFQTKLHLPGGSSREDLSGSSLSNCGVWIPVVRAIKRIERFPAKLNVSLFRKEKPLVQRGVCYLGTRSGKDTDAGTSELIRWRSGEGRGIKPKTRTWVGDAYWAHNIGPSAKAVSKGRSGHPKRKRCSRGVQVGRHKFPTSENSIQYRM